MVELLIRAHVPEWADKLDYSTLEKMPTELISKFLQRRYPDMIWRARTTDGETDVVFLMEVQGRPDLHMALRTANYAGLLIESIKEQGGLRPGGRLPEVVCIVLYHGNRPWNAPTRLADLFRHSPPNEYRLVSRRPADARTPPTSSDLPSMLLELARDWTLEEMQSHLRELGARGQNPPGIRAAMHPRWIAPLCVAFRANSAAIPPSKRLASPAPRRSRCSCGFIHGHLVLCPVNTLTLQQG